MSAICKYCKKRPPVIVPGNYLCARCHVADIGSPRMLRRSRTSARRAIALISDLAHDLAERVT
jgi:hypothetical protein